MFRLSEPAARVSVSEDHHALLATRESLPTMPLRAVSGVGAIVKAIRDAEAVPEDELRQMAVKVLLAAVLVDATHAHPCTSTLR